MKINLKSDKGQSLLMYMVYMIVFFLITGVVVYTAVDSGLFLGNTKDTVEYVDQRNVVTENNVVPNTNNVK